MTRGGEEADEPAAHTGAPPWMDPTVGRSQVLIALCVTLLISPFPEIVARELLNLDVPWRGWVIVGEDDCPLGGAGLFRCFAAWSASSR